MTDAAVLVVGPSWVGDMVMAQSLFRLLKQRQPARPIDVLAPEWSLPLISRMHEVRHGIALPFAHGELGLARRRRLGRELRQREYSQAIVLPRSMKAALVPWFAGVPRRTGFRGEMRFHVINDMRPLDNSLDQTVKRFLALGLPRGESPADLPQPRLAVSTERQQILLSELRLDLDKPVAALMPGAEYGPAKCWPHENFAALARELDSRHFHVWVLGSAADKTAGEFISGASRARNLCGKTSLVDAVDLLALCRHAVSNDSGLMHVAAATGVPVSAIYGSSTPRYTPPLSEKATIHYLALECSPCFERECPLLHLRCLREISVERVLTGIEREMSVNRHENDNNCR